MSAERTLILVKPDGVQRRLVGEITRRFESKGLRMVGLKLMRIDRKTAEKHYAVHKARPFFGELVTFITSGPVVAMCWEGKKAIEISRKVMGATKPEAAEPGTIRGDYSIDTGMNLVHGSDSPEAVAHELPLYFSEDELCAWEPTDRSWLGA